MRRRSYDVTGPDLRQAGQACLALTADGLLDVLLLAALLHLRRFRKLPEAEQQQLLLKLKQQEQL